MIRDCLLLGIEGQSIMIMTEIRPIISWALQQEVSAAYLQLSLAVLS
jgi:hypothetical protein